MKEQADYILYRQGSRFRVGRNGNFINGALTELGVTKFQDAAVGNSFAFPYLLFSN
ncbi:hypothetical protein [Chryseobacterium indologenes]|uniref:hypothetical protein n=1 Tax=Chryseobacterium indologenes TaxID=253 RepID=UPI000B3197ED|nr:hypothetical protein [Chryseobacterium indologenes]